jgi:GPH family glycoside/pentoside/hexuronide:cation symporter
MIRWWGTCRTIRAPAGGAAGPGCWWASHSIVGFLVLTYAVSVPARQGQGLFWYAPTMVMLFETASTVMSVNYDALFPELFQGVRVRARASSTYQGSCLRGELVGSTLTPIVYAQLGFVRMAMLFAAITGVTLTIGVVVIRRTHSPGRRLVRACALRSQTCSATAPFSPLSRS